MTEWVKERSQCSPAFIFDKLKAEIEQDVKSINELRVDKDFSFYFSLTSDLKCIVVSLHGTSTNLRNPREIHETITVCIDGKAIVYNRNTEEKLRATLTLNEKGECRLKVNGSECELWRFRQMVLEELFFDIV